MNNVSISGSSGPKTENLKNGSFSVNITPWGGGEGDRTINVSYTPKNDCTLFFFQMTSAGYDVVNYIHLNASYEGFKSINNRGTLSSQKYIEAVGMIPNAKAGVKYTIKSTVNMQAWQGNHEMRNWVEVY